MYNIRKLLYFIFVNNRVIKFLDNPALSIVIPPVVALYYGTLDIWGDDWFWIKDHRTTHGFIFSLLASITVVILFLKGMAESGRSAAAKKYQLLLESLISFFNELVKKKKDRFNNKARGLKPTGDVFRTITHPKDQLEHVLDGAKRLLVNGFGLDQKNVGITIIQGNPLDNKWWYELRCDPQRQHFKAKDLMTGSSTAKYCFDSGDSLFISDIRKGIKDGVFQESDRSKKSSAGSIFCKPVRVTVGKIEYVYIFTIAIFGEFLCIPYDEEECRACENILDEIGDRVELELYLHSIKQFKETGGIAA